MAGSSFFALFDDIAALLDDIAIMTKVAARKTAGVLGDDLALNANQVSGVDAARELPVVWAVAKGSAVNKLILIPAALLLSALLPKLVMPLLMIGGAYLCFEGVEKIAHKLFHSAAEDEAHHQEHNRMAHDVSVDMVAYEKDKIKGAIRTDFILSAEILVIALGEVEKHVFAVKAGVMIAIGVLMTIGVYGLVAAIVKMDDAGFWLQKRGGLATTFGNFLIQAAPKLMKLLSILGTAAMFLVGGAIVLHGIPELHHWIEHFYASQGKLTRDLLGILAEGIFGVLVGAICLLGVMSGKKLFQLGSQKPA